MTLTLWATAGLIAPHIQDPEIAWVFHEFSSVNGIIAVLSLLPVQPLEGGKLFEPMMPPAFPRPHRLHDRGSHRPCPRRRMGAFDALGIHELRLHPVLNPIHHGSTADSSPGEALVVRCARASAARYLTERPARGAGATLGDKSEVGARSRFFARSHLMRMTRQAHGRFPQVACLSFDLISMYVMLDGRYELEELEALARNVFPRLPSRTTCLDIGSNIGNHALFFSEHFEQVFAFEPHPRLFPLLAYNAALTDNVRAVPFGLSDRDATLIAAEEPGNIGKSRIAENAGTAVGFDVRKLDGLPEIQALDRIDFVKIDVEGHEANVVRGAEATLRRHRPAVAFEVLKDEIKDGTSACLDALRGVGYDTFYAMQSNRPFAWAPKPLAKIATFFIGVLFDRRTSKSFSLVRIDSLKSDRNYPMVLAFADPMPVPESN